MKDKAKKKKSQRMLCSKTGTLLLYFFFLALPETFVWKQSLSR